MKGWTLMMMSEICIMRIFKLNDVNFHLTLSPNVVSQSHVADHKCSFYFTVTYKTLYVFHFKQLSMFSD